jgi:EF hand domain-containing protein
MSTKPTTCKAGFIRPRCPRSGRDKSRPYRFFHGLSALIAAILIWAALAYAEAPEPARRGGPHPVFSVYDTDHDGYLSRSEYQIFLDQMRAHRAARGKGPHQLPELLDFDAIDTNHDGRISESEMVTALSHRMKGWRHRARHGQRGQAQKPAQGNPPGQQHGPASSHPQ